MVPDARGESILKHGIVLKSGHLKPPNAANAVVELPKLTTYALNPDHRVGGDKARLFKSILDMEAKDAAGLRRALLDAARRLDAEERWSDAFGTRYIIEFAMEWKGKRAMVRSVWFVRVRETFPRLVSCFPLTGERR